MLNARAAQRPEIGGVERWARELIGRLARLRPDAYEVISPPSRLAHRRGHAWEQCVLPARARAIGADLIFSPANLAPLAWPHNAVLIHDAAPLRHPEWFSRGYARWQGLILPRLARRAVMVLTVSDFSRREILELTGMADDRIAVVHGGVSQRFSPDADAEAASRALGLERPYVLTVATPSTRKNLGVLTAARGALAEIGYDLVAAGAPRSYLGGAAEGAVRPLGYIDDAFLPGLYAGAAAFVLPSLYEGYGLPCLEAMASGVPVVTANRGVLAEEWSTSALLCDPDDPEELSASLLAAVSDDALRGELRRSGLARAAGLTWENTAAEVDRLLAELAVA